jgi:hypothetical protein
MQEDEGLGSVIGARTKTMRQCSVSIFMMEALQPPSQTLKESSHWNTARVTVGFAGLDRSNMADAPELCQPLSRGPSCVRVSLQEGNLVLPSRRIQLAAGKLASLSIREQNNGNPGSSTLNTEF